MEDVLRVKFVFERGQTRRLIRRMRATPPFGPFVAECIDILAPGERIKTRGRSARERDSALVLGRVFPRARGNVFEGGISETERGVLIGHLGDRASIRLQADVWETSGRWAGPALRQCLDRIVG